MILGAAILCLVVGVSDGDTLKVRCGEPGAYEQVTLRLSGIDAPEKAQPWGDRSRQHLAGLCFQQTAKLTGRTLDRYRRTVADVECQGRDVGAAQVSAGMAWVYDKYSKGYEGLYPLQAQAQASRAGLWSDGTWQPPWEFRRKKRNLQ